jgi:hypothetical protein
VHEGDVELRRCESAAQRAGLEALLCDPEVARHLLVSFTREQGLAGNGARFERNFDACWQRLGFGGVLLHRRGEERPAGFVALKAEPADAAPRGFEIYFGVARERQGAGLAGAGVARFLAELGRRFGPLPVRAAINRAQNPAGCRVLEKQGFGFERWIPLADFASGALAQGSALLELWRVARRDACAETLAQAAFRLGQLREAARLGRPELEQELDTAIRAGGLARDADAAASAGRRALAAGEAEARYALYCRPGAHERS